LISTLSATTLATASDASASATTTPRRLIVLATLGGAFSMAP
jgi:hypothetical protein